MEKSNRYAQIVERIFLATHKKGQEEVLFSRTDIEKAAKDLKIDLPKNIGDVVYIFRYRTSLPNSIRKKAPRGRSWIIRPAGRGKYRFAAVVLADIKPKRGLTETKIPDATPGVIAMYSLGDEQALLAKLRYNRLVDIFTRVTCYPLQSHLRTTVPNFGQIETDEIYIGIDKRGAHYIFPVQAKAGNDRLNVVQIEQDSAMCRHKFPSLVCRPIAAQFISKSLIAIFELEQGNAGITISSEKHYRLVPPEKINTEDLMTYKAKNLNSRDG